VKQIKAVEIFSDVKCNNCISFNEGQCLKELPAISVEPDNRCSQGEWFFKKHRTGLRQICLDLLPFELVADVDDVLCKNCVFYRPARGECHFHRENVFKSAPEEWCDNGEWLCRDNNDEIVIVPFSFFYPNE
jgi:hypothetical protein